MRIEEIKEIAKQYGIKAGRMKKADLVRSIQAAEGNNTCFGTGQSGCCGQADCLWREDCD
ncbi:Rho termination factor N-terminal domain-containing protein [Geobacter sp. SVR]|uniref:Rho termination factor N-terminal domain-containing protein n=1 Tax=Geobacter sp. SVR TaxID=2495594 RepID=UPI00143EF684|nr:Rho termination factor N-terminal domain-containing protein [Geobacter sp. SVR]BCS55453.1 SAP domain-containing protein [Geobacter sp. SVR]GCF83456.1 SAP domain-containing protein [Geobacter sp. SVR]